MTRSRLKVVHSPASGTAVTVVNVMHVVYIVNVAPVSRGGATSGGCPAIARQTNLCNLGEAAVRLAGLALRLRPDQIPIGNQEESILPFDMRT